MLSRAKYEGCYKCVFSLHQEHMACLLSHSHPLPLSLFFPSFSPTPKLSLVQPTAMPAAPQQQWFTERGAAVAELAARKNSPAARLSTSGRPGLSPNASPRLALSTPSPTASQMLPLAVAEESFSGEVVMYREYASSQHDGDIVFSHIKQRVYDV